MNLQEALERIEALERRVKELEARPEQHFHYHTHPPAYSPPYMPTLPAPAPYPYFPQGPWVTCGSGNIAAGTSN